MKTWKETKKELLQSKGVAAEYAKLAPEYQLARLMITVRMQEGLTQTQLAEKAGTSQVVIARLESGQSNPRLETIDKVAKALGKKLTLEIA